MRVLHCIETLGSGGAERQLCYLAEGLVRAGHDVHVAYFGGGPYEERLRTSGVQLRRVDHTSPLLQLLELRSSIRRLRPDLVQTWLGRMNVVGGLASRSLRRPWIYGERSVRIHDRGLPGMVRQWLGARSSLLVANSEAGAALWRPIRPVEVVPNGLPLKEIAATVPASRAALGIDAQAELILSAGRFVPAKNIALLGEALSTVLAARPRAVALCCGDGELLEGFRAAMDRHGLGSRCLTPGHRADLWALLKTADLLFVPSRAEGQPNVVLEAMAAGCPLVLSDIRGHRELLSEAAAQFFAPDSLDGAVRAITAVLEDPSSARARAGAARDLVRRRSIDAMVSAYLRLYAQLLARAPA